MNSDDTAKSSPGVLTPQREVVLRLDGLDLSREGRKILSGINLSVYRGETVAIIGMSGSGKSTLVRAMIGALPPTRGKVEVFHQDIYQLGEDSLNAVRKRFGVLFESGALLSSMTVGENMALPLREHTNLDPELIQIIVKLKLELVGLRGFESLRPSQLSGGMRKRVGLARALALDPELLFYDEPSSGLDPITAGIIDKLTIDLARTTGVTSIVVTHSMESAFRVATHLVMLYEGGVRADGSPDEIRGSDDPLVQQFIEGQPEGPIPLRRSKVKYEIDLLT